MSPTSAKSTTTTTSSSASPAAKRPKTTTECTVKKERTDMAARKAEQNRLAQKAFRERKDLRIKDLEMRVALLSQALVKAQPAAAIKTLNNDHTDPRTARIAQLEMQVSALSAENKSLRDSAMCGPPPPPPPPSTQCSSTHWASDILTAMTHQFPQTIPSPLAPSVASFPPSPTSSSRNSPPFFDHVNFCTPAAAAHPQVSDTLHKRASFMDTVI
ncbi:hypothetical protein BJ741DRAFT_598442 [Chytriomyces cf. hyalinus JEL632]|nr:hypothetical protein BJ741DRAFT_598442 [Chytriomyces cf. hyalinus JEL632]